VDTELIHRQKKQVVERFGEWTAHNIQLKDDLWTIRKGIAGDEIKLRRVIQVVCDTAGRPLHDLRILDLACLEGLYAIEFAHHGAEVLAIEGRQANIAKARFAKQVLSLDNVKFIQDDVRNLSKEKYGTFDVVLCLGILYHLDAPDVFTFVENISNVCRGVAVIDTHVSPKPEKSHIWREKELWGRAYTEHDAGSSPEERQKALWASLDNTTSFWLTRPSLYNLLSLAGFTSAYECYVPIEPDKPVDRITICAVRGESQELICCPLMNAEPVRNMPEDSGNHVSKPSGRLHKVSKFVLRPAKRLIGELLHH